jgi:hypothetical protein
LTWSNWSKLLGGVVLVLLLHPLGCSLEGGGLPGRDCDRKVVGRQLEKKMIMDKVQGI